MVAVTNLFGPSKAPVARTTNVPAPSPADAWPTFKVKRRDSAKATVPPPVQPAAPAPAPVPAPAFPAVDGENQRAVAAEREVAQLRHQLQQLEAQNTRLQTLAANSEAEAHRYACAYQAVLKLMEQLRATVLGTTAGSGGEAKSAVADSMPDTKEEEDASTRSPARRRRGRSTETPPPMIRKAAPSPTKTKSRNSLVDITALSWPAAAPAPAEPAADPRALAELRRVVAEEELWLFQVPEGLTAEQCAGYVGLGDEIHFYTLDASAWKTPKSAVSSVAECFGMPVPDSPADDPLQFWVELRLFLEDSDCFASNCAVCVENAQAMQLSPTGSTMITAYVWLLADAVASSWEQVESEGVNPVGKLAVLLQFQAGWEPVPEPDGAVLLRAPHPDDDAVEVSQVLVRVST